MKKQNQTIAKSKLSDLRDAHGVTVLTNLKVIRGALLQGVYPPFGSQQAAK